MGRHSSTGGWIGAVVMVVAVVMAGAYLAYKATHLEPPDTGAATPASAAGPAVPASAAAAIRHPIEQAQAAPAAASTAALPALHDSDASVGDVLSMLGGDSQLTSLLVKPQIIARIVAALDALPRRSLNTLMLPVQVPRGAFVTDSGEGAITAGERNVARYAPYMRVVQNVDPQALVNWYVHAYPLFQEAYRQLGYPRGYFNDRLIVVIDDLLAAPEPARSAELVRSSKGYLYADPALEALSSGQKLMIRTGLANEREIKAKLRVIRTLLLGRSLPSADAPG